VGAAAGAGAGAGAGVGVETLGGIGAEGDGAVGGATAGARPVIGKAVVGANEDGTLLLNKDAMGAGVELFTLLPINAVGSLFVGTSGSGSFIVGNNRLSFGDLFACISANMLGVGPPAISFMPFPPASAPWFLDESKFISGVPNAPNNEPNPSACALNSANASRPLFEIWSSSTTLKFSLTSTFFDGCMALEI